MIKDKALELAKKLKDEQNLPAKVVRISDDYFILKPITTDEFFEFRKISETSPDAERDLVISHIVDEENFDFNNKPAGIFERLRELLYEVSGFTTNIATAYDPTVLELARTDIQQMINEVSKIDKSAKIIMINKIPFAIRPITSDEYMQYKSQTERIIQLSDKEAFEEAYKIDKELMISHLIEPKSLPIEAGYLELLFQALWQISGFTQDVEVIEV